MCFGRNRVESQRWVQFRSHYGFDAFYCIPGQDGAHEKGGVEHEGGRFRRTHLVPVPEVASLDELNARCARIDLDEEARVLHGQRVSVGFKFGEEAELLRPAPFEEFDCGLTLTPKVSRDARITVRQAQYSVPARFIGRKVRVSLRANDIVVFDQRTVIARHPRLTQRGQSRDELDHYLEILLGKPGALAGSTALATARSEGRFTPAHDAFWAAARRAHGDRDGTRLLIQVLLLHRHQPGEFVIAGITAVLHAGGTSPELVAIEARKAEKAHRDAHPLLDDADCAELGLDAHLADTVVLPAITPATPAAGLDAGETTRSGAEVISLRSHIPELQPRALPTLDVYDQLLTRRRTKGTTA